MQVTIPWTNGSGNIYLTYESGSGNDTVVVSSDVNDLDVAREQTLTFRGSTGLVRTVTVRQETNAQEVSVTWHPTSYDDEDYSYYNLQSVANGYTDSDSSNYAQIDLTRGSRAETYFYFKFDTSTIPSDATIQSVECSVKCYISTTNNNRVATREVQMSSGTTLKGSSHTVSDSTTAFDMSCGTWTRSELNDCRIKLHAVRGTNQTSGSQYFRFYGATLSVTYKVGGKYYITSDGKAYVTSDDNYYNCK